MNKAISLILLTVWIFSSVLGLAGTNAQKIPPYEVAQEENDLRAVKNVYVRVPIDDSFIAEFEPTSSGYASRARQIFDDAKNAFWNRFEINLLPTFTVIPSSTNTQPKLCPLSYNSSCTSFYCGSTCTDGGSGSFHHKNGRRYLDELYSLYPNGTYYDIMMAMTSYWMCFNEDNGIHRTGLGGLGAVNGEIGLTVAYISWGPTSRGSINVRNLQHELSHIYGALDNQCSGSRDCIMSDGLNNYDTSTMTYIWCSNCESRMNINRFS